ncbi:Retrotransposon-like protein 1 [Labeo rohita]|uniref:ribonuclease H n=1 Tax=Labeo rohita TaxID=84645 RepID=A0ABQ8M375_LABRO|nr:Retrotransposon-like protein 1 [Labeo rohita]
MALRQGRRPAADYALTFRTLAAQSGWNDGPLKLHYRKGLNPDLQVELACRDEDLSLEQYIDLSIRVDNVMRACKSSRLTSLPPLSTPSSEATAEPMQLGTTKLSLEERERRLRGNLCLYCGLAGHIRANCPTRPPRQPSSVSHDKPSSNCCVVPITLEFGDNIVKTTALIDSGAAGNFIDADFVAANHSPTLSCSPHVSVAALDGRPLGSGRINQTTDDLTLHADPSHQETIRFFVITSPQSPVILEYPWLNQHGPSISWADCTITRWSPHCRQHCLRTLVRPPCTPCPHNTTSSIPPEYQDLLEAFSRTRATQLPPHRPGDCAIDLIPAATPPRGRVFPLSQAESEAMHNLSRVLLRQEERRGPSTLHRLSWSQRGNVKYRYPLPLVPSALEQLRTARIFTKLDLRSAYNLVRIRAGDEWKTAFSTTSGHYEYRVMPFGLANSPSCFQAFINDVFRDMLNRWVIVYIDDILVYSNSYSEHVKHVRTVLQRLISHQLYAKEEKCDFHKDKISFLVYIISSEGVAMDERKVDAVLNWPRPTTLRELQRFLGFANFYRRFIRNFSTVAAPLSAMVKKGTSRLTWSQAALQAFDDLRRRFSTAPILHHPDPERPFVVEVDASSTGVVVVGVGVSVTTAVSVAPSDRRQGELSPDF